jgi:cobalt/nickel transport system ATP-binding protein/precorrin-8X/cobalt-precorrin-8 methylmutase
MLMHDLLARPLSGPDIEDRSMAIIDQLCAGHRFDQAQWLVAKRLVHTTGDPSIIDDLRFSPDWLEAGARALRAGAPITSDAKMVRSGISLARLRELNPGYGPGHLHCHVDDPAVAAEARATGLPRSLYAVRAARALLDGAICCFGNAPVGLMELSRLIVEEGVRPALVIGMPVGFVHVVESKDELMSLGVPWIAIAGRRGGSPLAVATIHALCLAAQLRKGTP